MSKKTYTVIFAEDVPHYAIADIEAKNLAEALKAAKAYDTDSFCGYDPDWDHSVCKRIVHIEDEQGRIVAEDIPLDDFHLRNGGEPDRRLCDAARDLYDALIIARIELGRIFRPENSEILRLVNAAIAKAEGGAQ